MEIERDAKGHVETHLEVQIWKEKCVNFVNLQPVLEDLPNLSVWAYRYSRAPNLRSSSKGLCLQTGNETQRLQVTQLLAEFKGRAPNAELRSEESSTNNSCVHELEGEVKSRTFWLVSYRRKVRHEVAMNMITCRQPSVSTAVRWMSAT